KGAEGSEAPAKGAEPKAGAPGKGPAAGPGGAGGGPPGGGAGPGGPGGDGKKGGGFKADPDMQKKMQEFDDKMKKGSPQERKNLLNQVPESYRDQVKKRYKDQGMEIAD